MDGLLFRTGEVASILRCCHRTVTLRIDDGTIKGMRLPGSRHRRVVRKDLEQFMRKQGYPMEWLTEFERNRKQG